MQKIPTPPLTVSVREAVRLTSVSRSRLYELLELGEILAVKDGKRTLVVLASIQAWLARLMPWRGAVGPLLPPEDRALVRERVDGPDFAGLFADHLQHLTPTVGESEARVQAFAYTIRAYRRSHECAYKRARAAVLALIEPKAPSVEPPKPDGSGGDLAI